jgi:DNA-binding ferritin-like protein
MPRKNTALPAEQQAKLIEILNRRLADAIDLRLQSRQAYWNVKGPHFMSLRELFSQVADFGRHVRYASAQASDLLDADTAAILTEIGRGIDKWLWFVETSQQAGS